MKVLEKYVVSEHDEWKSSFQLPWNIQDKSLESSKKESFTIENLRSHCKVEDSKYKNDEIDRELEKIICEKIQYVDIMNQNQFYRKVLNCCMLKRTPLYVEKSKDALARLLRTKEKLSAEDFSPFKSSLFTKLKEQTQVVWKNGDGNYELVSPYITKSQAERLKNIGICLQKLIQFLRMHCPLDEGEYNELYHLHNCEHACHTQGWVHVVGDRILAGTMKIELFDVMAYKERLNGLNLCYMLHVKEGSNATSARAVCSQVKVCADQVSNSMLVGSSIFDLFYVSATSEPTSTHQKLTRRTMLQAFPTKDDFSRKMTQSHIKVCLTLGDKAAMTWRDKTKINLDFDVNNGAYGQMRNEVLKLFLGKGFISLRKGYQINQKIIDRSKEAVLKELNENKPKYIKKNEVEAAYVQIFKKLSQGDPGAREFLLQSYITKIHINDLSDQIASMQVVDSSVDLIILPLDVY